MKRRSDTSGHDFAPPSAHLHRHDSEYNLHGEKGCAGKSHTFWKRIFGAAIWVWMGLEIHALKIMMIEHVKKHILFSWFLL